MVSNSNVLTAASVRETTYSLIAFAEISLVSDTTDRVLSVTISSKPVNRLMLAAVGVTSAPFKRSKPRSMTSKVLFGPRITA